jgi:hypothetical protein
MYGLLEAATVLEGDGTWTAGYEVDALSCGRVLEPYDTCTPGTPDVEDSGTGFKIDPWAIVGGQKFGVRCEPKNAREALAVAMADSSEYFTAKNFWNGDVPDWVGVGEGMYLEDSGIATVAAGADTKASIAAALGTAYAAHPDIIPIVHLGLGAALSITDLYSLDALGFKYVVSPGYPTDGIAVTGPIVVRLGSVEILKSHDEKINRSYVSGTRLVAVEFDPCLAVRVA